MSVLIINGPNLNLLGSREVQIYGSKTYTELINFLSPNDVRQSNHEGQIIDWIQEYKGQYGIINAGAYTHYSYAIRDAIAAVTTNWVEVHLSDPKTREPFRHLSVIEDVCVATFKGQGFDSYKEAIEWINSQ